MNLTRFFTLSGKSAFKEKFDVKKEDCAYRCEWMWKRAFAFFGYTLALVAVGYIGYGLTSGTYFAIASILQGVQDGFFPLRHMLGAASLVLILIPGCIGLASMVYAAAYVASQGILMISDIDKMLQHVRRKMTSLMDRHCEKL